MTLQSRPTAIERAFQLAMSGRFTSVQRGARVAPKGKREGARCEPTVQKGSGPLSSIGATLFWGRS